MKTTLIRVFTTVLLSSLFYILIMLFLNTISIKDYRLIIYAVPYIQRVSELEVKLAADFDSTKKYDAIVYGSSHAYRGYDPRIFKNQGYSLFCAGTGSQSTTSSLLLATHVIPPKSGKLIIFDIYDAVWGIPDLENANLLIQNFPNNDLKVACFKARPDIRKFNQLVSSYFTSKDQKEKIQQGYVINGYCTRTDTVSMPWPAVDVISEIDQRYIDDFNKLITLTENNDVKFVFVSHPLPPLELLANNHKLLKPIIDEIAKNHGVMYLDYTHHPDFANPSFFADENHLNQAGVDHFNEILIADLKKHQLLPQ